MEQSPSIKGNWFSASEEIPCILWNQKVNYHIYEATACPYPEPDQSSPCPSIPIPEDPS